MLGLPPIDSWVGSRDITLPDSRLQCDRLDPSLTCFHELPGAVHVVPLLPLPEGSRSRRAIVERASGRLHSAH